MNNTALITGASGGIGYELATIHAKNGDNLVLVARSINKLMDLKQSLERLYKITVYAIQKDLSQKDSAVEVYNELKSQNISVDFLINNAGIGDYDFYAESDWERQEQMINVNITALSHLTRLFLPDMIKHGYGKILNVASTASFQPGPKMSVYFASKAYVLSFSEAINNEVRDKGVTVTALCPGSTQSAFQATAAKKDDEMFAKRKIPSAQQVAEFGYKAMMKGQAVAVHGLKNKIFASAIRFLPRSVVVNATRKIQEKKFPKDK